MPDFKISSPLGNFGRTTIVLDSSLSTLLALQLGDKWGSPTAHRVIRLWLQKQLNENSKIAAKPTADIARWLMHRTIDEIAKPELLSARDMPGW